MCTCCENCNLVRFLALSAPHVVYLALAKWQSTTMLYLGYYHGHPSLDPLLL